MSKSLDEFQDTDCQSDPRDDRTTRGSPQGTARGTAYDALVLEARLRQSLVTVRSLGSRGLRVAALESFDRVPTFSSRWCQQAFVCPSDKSEVYINYLEKLLDDTNIGVLIISTDADAALIRQHRQRLEKRVRIALAGEPALGIALNKKETLAVASRLGISIPRSALVRIVGEVEAALDEVGLPAVIKPIQSWVWDEQKSVGLACTLVNNAEEARRASEALANQGIAALFQQFLPGRREAVSFLYARGQIYARFAQWANRTLPPLGGTSVLRQSIAVPQDIGDQAERLVREIELEGYSEVEFRRGSDGTPYLMEINPRLSASVEIAVRAGVDFPYLLYQWASGEKIAVVKSYRAGGWMRYLAGDLESTLYAVSQRGRPEMPAPARALFDFSISFFKPMRYDYLDWKDPLPAFVAFADSVRYWSKRVRRRLAGKRWWIG